MRNDRPVRITRGSGDLYVYATGITTLSTNFPDDLGKSPSTLPEISTASMSALSFLYSQLFVEPPVPTHDFQGQTVIITGSNRGIGFEAARHLLRLNVSRLILAARSAEKGQIAADTLEQLTGRSGVIQVEELDMANQESVQEFATRMEMCRIDAVLLNAGIYTHDFVWADNHESTLTVNVINTFLLAILLLPALRRSSKTWVIQPCISFVASDRHVMYDLPEWKTQNTFQVLNDRQQARMHERYPISKLLEILLARAMAKQLDSNPPNGTGNIIVNSFTPGYCTSGLIENVHGITGFALWLLSKATARTTEVGGRTLVAAIAQGDKSHGKYLNDGHIDESALSPFVRSQEGILAMEKLWEELMEILEQKRPGIGLLLSPVP
ncbi:Short-chain dehydrogenase/reductase SDR [Penicillium roqueforti FM164]|uniref:Short-chain dehydrogenase anuD n=1 Tax=Penicillium roqueforti (strain FM164) TaxID=1365484 RepID=ANUD_PENRF|nr:RecName: Full=Short-chain dehydrogenase anuD; AltName: Full=Annullatin D biosynthesis cluster protein D [Penicillium roqueforti FM164]CDM34453.1 Short-chain dehydrogenase/reductase SDR [Penicillium roqueforti FM164]